jgi:hypothetical protein
MDAHGRHDGRDREAVDGHGRYQKLDVWTQATDDGRMGTDVRQGCKRRTRKNGGLLQDGLTLNITWMYRLL